jgi:hypothetical protein
MTTTAEASAATVEASAATVEASAATVASATAMGCKRRRRHAKHPENHQHGHSYLQCSIRFHRSTPFPRQMLFAHFSY